MLTLTLIRHAKSSWSRPDLGDHDRTLNERGLRAAPQMGRWLAAHGWAGENGPGLPDHWLSSTATRARLTAEIMAGECGLPLTALHFDRRLYLADSRELLHFVRETPVCRHLVLFSHNPGIEDFANELLETGGDLVFKTSAVACLTLPQDEWQWLDFGTASLRFHTWPAQLEQDA